MRHSKTIHCDCSTRQKRAIIGFSLFIAAFYGLIVGNLPILWSKVAFVVYTLGIIELVMCIVYCSVGVSDRFRTSGEEMKECKICDRMVEATSVHCDMCQTCIRGYRHHSDWLQVCIGSRNLFAYLGLLVGLLLASAVELASGLWLTAVVLHGEEVGRSLAAVRYTQKYSLNDGGYCFKITLLFVSATSLAVLLAALANLATHTCVYCVYTRMRVTSQVTPEGVAYSGKTEISDDMKRNADGTQPLWQLGQRKEPVLITVAVSMDFSSCEGVNGDSTNEESKVNPREGTDI